jgi:hypothetical protein
MLAGLAGLSLLVCGCGGSGSSPTTSAGSAQQQGAVAYSRCMREHGVPNFPDPNSQGQFPPFQLDSAVSAQTAQTAQTACQHLMPHGGGGSPQPQARLAQALKLAKCMRKHGFPGFPDPTPVPGGVSGNFAGTGIDPNSPPFQRAQTAC